MPNNFNSQAEQEHYQTSHAVAPSVADLDSLAADMRLWVPDLPHLFKSKRILDVGAGTAPLGTLIAERFAPKTVVSLELVMHRLRVATVWQEKLSALQLACGNIFTLPFPDGYFDYVLGNSVLHHLPHLSQATAEIGRVLRSGGFYIGREPNFNNPLVRWSVFNLHQTPFFPSNNTPNEYPLRAQEIIDSFAQAKCDCHMHYFWRRLPSLHHPIFSVAMSVRAQRL